VISLIISPLNFLGELAIFAKNTAVGIRSIHRRVSIVFRQFDFIGVQSFGVISFSGMFVGGVMSFQTYIALHTFNMDAMLGSSVGIALMRELAPVFCGIMVAGRAGAAMAAELATMRVTEQLDAMEALGTDPHDYLVTPRILAGVLSAPILCIYFTIIGCLAGYIVGTYVCDVNGAEYWQQLAHGLAFTDIWQGLTKAVIFGFILSLLSCFYGFHAEQSAEGVGIATNKAVVASVLWILFGDYVLTAYLPYDPGNFGL
jgi:phospholipid/cholesterol/gamma-HCH transport system permease protein